jgi:nucleotide-binding universal stress UspA family protein
MPAQHLNPINIMLAVDGSEHSLAAIALLHDLPLHPESTITALAVLDLRHTLSRATLLAVLDKTQNRLEDTGLNILTGLLHGNPAEELTHYAEQHRPDLLVLGAKGLRSTLGILLGGVAQQVIEYATWPVLVVRAPYTGLNRVLLVTDGSLYSQRAITYLGTFPLPDHIEVRVANVIPPIRLPESTVQNLTIGMEIVSPIARTQEELDALEAKERAAGEFLLSQSVEKLRSFGLEAKSTLLQGDAATEIIEYVKKHKIDLIVAGSRGLSQMKSWLLGSVSRKLVHYSNCSTLVVKGIKEAIH